MKRLIVALVASVAVSAAFAKIVDTRGFEAETDRSVFAPDVEGEDASFLDTYGTRPDFTAPYSFSTQGETAALQYGEKFFSLDTGDATLWRANENEAAYFDMAMQFNPCASAPDLDAETKIAVYLNSASNLVVLAGNGANVTATMLAPGTWARLSISAVEGGFKVYLNGTPVATADAEPVSVFPSRTSSTAITYVGFKGTGALDDFVARTTDPYLADADAAASIAGENYASLEAAVADASAGDTILLRANVDDSTVTVVLPAANVTFNTNGKTFAGKVSAANGFGWTEVSNGVYLSDNNTASTWTNAIGDNDWTNGDNWSNHAVPTSSTAVTIPATEAEGGWLIYVGGDAHAASVNLLGDATIQRDAGVTGLGNLVVNGDITTGSTASTLTLYVASIIAPAAGTPTVDCNIKTISTKFESINSGFRTLDGSLATFTLNGDIEMQGVFFPRANITFKGNVRLNNGHFTRVSSQDYYSKNPGGTPVFDGPVELIGDSSIRTYAVTYNDAVTLAGTSYIYINSQTQTYGNDFSLSGSGRVVLDNCDAGAGVKTQFQKTDGTWTGTCEMRNLTSTIFYPNNYANSNSSICFNNAVCGTFGTGNATYVMKVELLGNGLELNGDYSRTIRFSNSISGSGALNIVQMGGSNSYLYLEGDTSGFTGGITVAGTQNRVVFGSAASGNATGIEVAAGSVVTNSAAWTAPVIYLAGELVGNGGSVSGELTGSGVYRVINSASAATVTDSWTGTYVIGWNLGSDSTEFAITNYGCNADATIQIDGVNNAFQGYPRVGDDAPSVTAKVKLNANWTIGNGWTDQTTTFASLSGGGDLIVNGNGSGNGIPYTITKLDNYTGTLRGNRGKFTVNTVNVSDTPTAGTRVVKVDTTAGSTINGAYNLTVSDEASGKLVYAKVSDNEGLYAPTVQSGDDYYLSIAAADADGKTAFTLLADNAENVVLKAGGSIEETGGKYTGEATTVDGYKVVYDDATGTWTSVVRVYVAQIVGGAQYETLSNAVEAAVAGDTLELIADATDAVTLDKAVTLDPNGHSYTGALSGPAAGRLTLVSTNALTFGTWSGTVVIGWDPNGAFNFNNYGVTGSTVEVNTWNGYQLNTASTVNPAVKVNTSLTMSDGYTTLEKKTTFAEFSGAGNLNFTKSNGNGDFYYEISRLNSYTGTISVNNGLWNVGDTKKSTYVTVGSVNLLGEPALNERVVKTSLGDYGDIWNATGASTKGGAALDVTVNGVASSTKLAYSANGFYVAVASVIVNEATTNYYTTAAAAAIAAANASVDEFTLIRPAAATEIPGWTYNSETGKYVKNPSVASIGGVEYETLSGAISAAGPSDTIMLLAKVSDAINLNKAVTLDPNGYSYTGELSGTSAGRLTLVSTNVLTFGTWSGTVVIGWNPNGAFNFNNYGVTGSTVEVNTWNGYQLNTAFTVNPAVKVNTSLTMSDGYTTEAKKTTFAEFSGAGNLNFTKGNGNGDFYYEISRLNSYTGTISVNNGNSSKSTYVTVGSVNLLEEPAVGERVVKTSLGDYGDIWNATGASTKGGAALDVTVNGVASSTKLAYNANGFYVAVAQVGSSYYVTLTAAAAAAEAAGAASFTKLADTAEAMPAGWKLDPVSGNYVKIVYVAQIGQDGATYETVVEALQSAEAGNTVYLLANTHERVNATVNNDITLDINGKTMTSPADDVIVKNGTGTLTILDSAVTPGLVKSTINGEDLGVAVWVRQGSVVIKSGVFENNSNYEATVYVGNGAFCTIEGGTFRNVAEGTYHWKTAWAPITLNVQNKHASESAAISVSGGSFTTDPANGDDYFGGTFLAAGKATTLEAGYYVVGVAQYTVRFFDDVGGSQIGEAQTVAYGAKATAPAAPTKVGYTFTGWNPDTNAVIAAATDFHPVWAGKSFTICTYTNGVANATTNFTYAGETVAPAAPLFDSETEEWDGKFYTTSGGSTEFVFDPAGESEQVAYATITAKSSPVTPVAPGEDITPPTGKTATEYASDINAAIANGTGESYIEVPAEAEASGTKAAYLGILKAQVNKDDSNKIDIVFDETATGYAAVTNAIETVAIPAVGDVLPTVAAAAAESSTDVTIASGLTPGLYYSISYCTDLANFGTQYENEGTRVKANASGAATLQTPAKASAATAGFYRVNVNVSDK